jgi:hypothetical protein
VKENTRREKRIKRYLQLKKMIYDLMSQPCDGKETSDLSEHASEEVCKEIEKAIRAWPKE